jgi:ketosteroid isomerase-like protein
VIFFARYEATEYGSPYIETEHLLLGLLREDGELALQLVSRIVPVEDIRRSIESRIQRSKRIRTNVDVPLSQECHNILRRAAKEADRLDSQSVETGHLLLALLAEEKCLAVSVLKELGIAGPAARDRLLRGRRISAEKYLRQTLDAMVAAWLQRNVDALRACVADDALFIDTLGRVYHGRESLFALISTAGSGVSSVETRRISLENITIVQREVAVVSALCDLAGLDGPRQIRLGLTIIRRTAGWEIVSAQLTDVRPHHE